MYEEEEAFVGAVKSISKSGVLSIVTAGAMMGCRMVVDVCVVVWRWRRGKKEENSGGVCDGITEQITLSRAPRPQRPIAASLRNGRPFSVTQSSQSPLLH